MDKVKFNETLWFTYVLGAVSSSRVPQIFSELKLKSTNFYLIQGTYNHDS